MDWRRRAEIFIINSIFSHEFFFVFFFVALWHCSWSLFQSQDQQCRGSDGCQQTQVRISQEPAPWLSLQVRFQTRPGISPSLSFWSLEWECLSLRCVWFVARVEWGRIRGAFWPSSQEEPLMVAIWGIVASIGNPNSLIIDLGSVPKWLTSWFLTFKSNFPGGNLSILTQMPHFLVLGLFA